MIAFLTMFIGTSAAQEANSAEGFNAWGFTVGAQDGDLRDPITFNRPGQINVAEWYAAGILGFAKAPLYLVEQTGEDTTRTAALDNVVGLDLAGGVAPIDRVRIDLAVPIFAASGGSFGSGGPAFGDLTAAAMVVPLTFGTDDEGGIGFRPWVALPTGASGRYLGSRGLRGGADASVTGAFGPWTLTGSGGLAFNGAVESFNIEGSDSVVLGASVGRLIGDRTGVSVEGHLRLSLGEQVEPFRESPGEALVSVRHRLESGAHFLGGAGTSVTPGVGAAEFRVFLGGGYGVLKRPPPDSDGDGLIDELDKCPDEPELERNGYLDDDGCPDELAEVTLHAVYEGDDRLDVAWGVSIEGGDPTEYVSTKDIVLRDQMPGQSWGVTAAAECMDGSGAAVLAEGPNQIDVELSGEALATTFLVVDVEDNPIPNARLKLVDQPDVCPYPEALHFLPQGEVTLDFWPGAYQVTANAEKFETRVTDVEVVDETQTVKIQLSRSRTEIEGGQIRILEKVLFETASSNIKPISFQLLDEVAAVLIDHSEITLIEVQGHADERGSSRFNLKLSTDRARSVRQYLVDAGVAEERLVVQGYGEDQPLQAGSDEAAWAQNRRVQFVIRESTDAAE